MQDVYENPLTTRYADEAMSYLFSDEMKYRTWRDLWIALAEAEHEMGLPVTEEQVNELKAHRTQLNLDRALELEHETRHDVMAHIRAYAEQCPEAAPIIHLGATSCFVTDNADLIIMSRALNLVEEKLAAVLAALADFARRYADTPTLAFTHLQPAQPTTVGKRATLWMQDLLMDLSRLQDIRSNYMLRGLKGATGTQASFMGLLDNDYDRVMELEQRVINKVGFVHAYPVTGQTYPRKFDSMVMDVLSGIAQSGMKFAGDVRLLQSMSEIREPAEDTQVGSSAMPYKRNPMRSERLTSLARFSISLSTSAAATASSQWLERTLDDSANRRLMIPQVFLATTAILNLYANIASGLTVSEHTIQAHLAQELPFFATESVLMESVRRGGDRQQLHEKIRQYASQAGYRVRNLGEPNTLLEVIAADPDFALTREELADLSDPARYVGAAPQQVANFLDKQVAPVLDRYTDAPAVAAEIRF